MNGSPATPPTELELDELAFALIQRISLLSRLAFARSQSPLHRNEASLLARLESGPQRISTLCEHEALAQPTVTLLVKRLEGEGFVTRAQDPTDGRAVLVSLTDSGRSELNAARAGYISFMRRYVETSDGEQLAALAAANDAIAELIARIEDDNAAARAPHRLRNTQKGTDRPQ